MSKIPRIIHQMWIGPLPPPLEMMETWQVLHPDWEYRLWNETSIRETYPDGFINQHHIDAHQSWAGKCDIMRYEILFRYGGFFVDADSVCLHPLEDHFLQHEAFACFENEEKMGDLVANGYLGVVKGSPLMKECISAIQKAPSLTLEDTGLVSWRTVGPLFFTNILKSSSHAIMVYPSYTFIPTHHSGLTYEGPGKSYADQKWGSTFGYENIAIGKSLSSEE